MAEQGMWKELKQGIDELTKSRSLLTITLAIAAVTVVYVPVSSLFPLMVRNHFGGGALQAGTVEAAFAGGMVLGSLLLGIWGAKLKRTLLICGGVTILGAGLVVSGLLPPTGLIWFIVCSIVLGISGPLFGGAYSALLQSVVDPASLGRVFSLVGTISLIATPIGLAVAGPMAEMLGVAAWFAISGALIMIVGTGTFLMPSVIALGKEQQSRL